MAQLLAPRPLSRTRSSRGRLRNGLGRVVALAMVLGVGLPVLVDASSWPALAEDPGAGAPLAGTVVDPAGDPVAGAVVSVLAVQYEDGYYAYRSPDVVATATTDTSGVYVVDELALDEYGLVVTPPVDDPALLASGSRDTYAGQDHPVVEDFQLAVSTLRGTVTRSDGSPAAGALVEAGEIYEDGFALTGADGTYRLAPDAGATDVSAFPPVVNPALDVAAHARVQVPAAGAFAVQDLQLGQPNLRGTVHAPDGTTALAGALVRLVDVGTSRAVAHGRMPSRGDGSFGFAVPAGRYRLEVAPPAQDADIVARTVGEAFDVSATDTPANPKVQNLTMLGTTLTGVVRDPSGDPVPAAPVYLFHLGTNDLLSSRTDDTGHYGFRIPTGPVRVYLYKPRPTLAYVDTIRSFDVTEVPTVRDLSFRAPNVLGRVVDQGGLPAAGVTVQVVSPTVGEDDVAYASTDRDGRFAMLLAPATHRLVAQPDDDHPTGVRTAKPLTVTDSGTAEVEIVLDPPTTPAYELMRLPVLLDDQPAYEVRQPAISGDGAVVAVGAQDRYVGCDCGEKASAPSDRRTDGPGGGYDEGIVLYDVPTGQQELLTSPSGVQVDRGPRLALDHDGSRVAFVTNQPDLADGTWDDRAFVLDRDADTLTVVEPPPAASDEYMDPWYDDSYAPALSGDGRTLALTFVHEDADWNRVHSLEVVTFGDTGGITSRKEILLATEVDPRPAISSDGSTLAWLDFVDGAWALRVMDLGTGQEEPTRAVFPGADRWDEPQSGPSLSADGSVVAYPHDRFVPSSQGYLTQRGGVRVWDRDAQTDEPVPLFGDDGGPADDGVQQSLLSADGRELVVVSDGPFLEDDTEQVWAVDLQSMDTVLVSADHRGQPGRNGVHELAAPDHAGTLAFATNSANLTGVPDGEESYQQQVVLAFAEEVPPEWPDSAVVTTQDGDIGSTSLRVRWTEATDNVGVSRYRVYLDGDFAGTTPADTRVLRLSGLEPDTEYDVTVQAVDSRGSESTDGPTALLRTLPADSVQLRPLEGTVAPGGVVSLSWEAPSNVDEVLVRRHVGDVVAEEQSLAPDADTTTQSGLAADTPYGFQVFVRIGEQVRAFSERIELRTRPMTIDSVTWEPVMVGPVAQRGLVVPITVVAERGRSVTATVDFQSWYDDQHRLLDVPVARSALVTLAEDPAQPGTYRGGFEVVDGVAELTRVGAAVRDGAGHEVTRTSPRPAVGVSSELAVEVEAPTGSFAGGFVQATGPGWYGQPIGTGRVVTFPNPVPGKYEVRVYDSLGDQMGVLADVPVRPGLLTSRTVQPRLPASLEVVVRSETGAPVTDGSVEVRDHASGEWLGRVPLDGTGRATTPRLRTGQVLDLLVDFPDRTLLRDQQREVTVVAGVNRVDVTAAGVPRPDLSGVVAYEDGDPVEGALVRLVQTLDGFTHTFVDQTGQDGRYDLRGLSGVGQLSVTAGTLSHREEVDLTGGATTRDVTLHGPRMYTLRLRLFTRSPGATSEVGPVALDWRTAVHYGMRITVDGRYQWYTSSAVADDGSTLVSVNGTPGQRLDWCIEGHEPRLAATCTRATLGSERSLTLEMHAGPATEVIGRALDGGSPLYYLRGDLYRIDDAGRTLVSSRNHYGQVREVVEAGDYEIVLSSDGLSGRKAFSVEPEQTRVELGDVQLTRATTFAGEGNQVQSARRQALPGSTVELHATWRNNTVTAATGTVARITVPAGTELAPDSVLLDGRPVTVTSGEGHADVAVGSVAPGAVGTLIYRLRLGDAVTGMVPGAVEMRYGDGPVREQLPPTTVRIAGLTIGGPASLTSRQLPLSGRAPAGSLVEVVLGDALLGQAVATPGGYWSQTVTLPKLPRTEPLHRVVARTTLDGRRLTAEHQVSVDDSRPVATSVSMYQVDGEFPNGRTFTFDPRNGVARFPFVFVPGQPLVVDVTFDHPELVSSAEVHIGAVRVPAVRQADGRFQARTTVSSVNGPVRLSYEASAKPIDMTEPEQSEQEIRDQAPAPLQGFGISDVVQPDASGSGPRVGSFTSTVPSVAGGSVRATLTVSRETYTTTEGDVASQAASGSSVHGLRWNRAGNTLTFSFVVPLSELPGAEDGAFGRLVERAGIRPAPRAAGAATGVARVSYQLAFNGTTTLDSLLSAFGAGEKYQKLADAIDAAAGCSPAKASAYSQRAQNIALAAAAGDVGGALFNIGALVFGPATFGLGTVALGVLGWALDKAIGYAIDQATETLVNDIKGDADCEDEDEEDDDREEDDNRDDVAEPTWIYDPSGYTFEGARSARVSGVTATLLTAPTSDGPWTAWDAEWFGQINPQTTDLEGRYGWDVPEGWWKVAYTKAGYLPAYSRVLRVLPPHLDVDVSLVKEGFPHVTGAVLRGGAVDVDFDRMVRSSSLAAVQVVNESGATVPGTWAAKGADVADDGTPLQQGARFVPTGGLTPGSKLTLTVEQVVDYSGRPMTSPYTATLTVPTGGGGPGDPPDDPKLPAAPTGVGAVAGERSATVTWSPPGADAPAVTSSVVTVVQTGRQVVVDGEATEVTVDALTPGTPYTFTVTARNQAGTGPASAPSNAVVPLAVAPETALTSGPEEGSVVTSRSATLGWASTGPAAVAWQCVLDGEPVPCASSSLRLRRLESGTHTFEVSAVDADGDADLSPATRTWTVPRDDRVLDTRGAWRVYTDRRAFDRTYVQSEDRGATLVARVSGATGLVMVVGSGPRHGRVTVWLDKRRLGSFDLSSRTVQHARIVELATFDTPRSGPLRIEVRSRGKVVRVDGLAVMSD